MTEAQKSDILERKEFEHKPFLITYNCYPVGDNDWEITTTVSGKKTITISTETLVEFLEGRKSLIWE